MKLDWYLASWVPPLRTAPKVLGPTSYKHVTPTESRTTVHGGSLFLCQSVTTVSRPKAGAGPKDINWLRRR